MITLPAYPTLHIVDHPLVQHKLTEMRDSQTTMAAFRSRMREIALLLAYEVTRDLPITTRPITTPLIDMNAPTLAGVMPAIVPILRAGMVMADSMAEQLIPNAPIGHIGLYRDHNTHEPVEYMKKLPDNEAGRVFILVDPMLATGHSLGHAVRILQDHGVAKDHIRVMALVAAPEGAAYMSQNFPAVQVYTAAIDSHLDEHAYIVPGLGDAGDRLFGTK